MLYEVITGSLLAIFQAQVNCKFAPLAEFWTLPLWFHPLGNVHVHGWEDYYLKAGEVNSELLIAANTTVIKDNHFRDIRTVPAGSILGTPTKKSHEYDKVV